MSKKQEDHNRGQERGSKAGEVEKWVQTFKTNLGVGNEAYNKGHKHGSRNPSKKR